MIAQALAEHVAEQTQRSPRITPLWQREIRLLLDRDLIPAHDALETIDWLRGPQGADFWARNILSPTKLRKHYPRLVAERLTKKPLSGRERRQEEALDSLREWYNEQSGRE